MADEKNPAKPNKMEVHVVSKADNSQHAAVTVENSSSSPLEPSSIRVRSVLVSLTSNNLSYARAGEWLHWYVSSPVYDDTT